MAERLILDHPDLVAIRVSPVPRHRALKAWLCRAAPELAERLHREPVDLLDHVPALLDPEVPLAGGGSLAIEPTRALTAIDVDAGAARDPLAANLAAAAEIGRQLRLRNIGGLVVVDFISLDRAEARAQVMQRLRGAVAEDPAQLRLSAGFSALGLVELARQRRGRSLAEAVAGSAFRT